MQRLYASMTVLERGKVTVLLIKALSFLEKFCVLVSKCKKNKNKTKQNKTKANHFYFEQRYL